MPNSDLLRQNKKHGGSIDIQGNPHKIQEVLGHPVIWSGSRPLMRMRSRVKILSGGAGNVCDGWTGPGPAIYQSATLNLS